jgi:flagellar motor switch protein FliM
VSEGLSSEDIARLFAAAKEGELPEVPRRKTHSRSIRKIDFSRPNKLSVVEQTHFERAHGMFCKNASDILTNELRSAIALEVINSSQFTWQAALEELPRPSLRGVVACAPGDGAILMSVEEGWVLRVIECMLGGSYTDRPAARELTEIDTILARNIFETLLRPLSSVWEDVLGLELSFLQFEIQDTTLEFLHPVEHTLELTIEVRDAKGAATIVLLVPYTAISEAGRSLLDGATRGVDRDAPAAESMWSALSVAKVEVRAEVGATDLTLGEAISLREQDIVRLGVAGEVVIAAGERGLFHARPGRSSNHRAVVILAPAEGSR